MPKTKNLILARQELSGTHWVWNDGKSTKIEAVIVLVLTPAPYIQDNLAVVKEGQRSWQSYKVVHLPSGFWLASTKLLRDARSTLESLHRKAIYETETEYGDILDDYANGASAPRALTQEFQTIL